MNNIHARGNLIDEWILLRMTRPLGPNEEYERKHRLKWRCECVGMKENTGDTRVLSNDDGDE
jgi:hypothetical protein